MRPATIYGLSSSTVQVEIYSNLLNKIRFCLKKPLRSLGETWLKDFITCMQMEFCTAISSHQMSLSMNTALLNCVISDSHENWPIYKIKKMKKRTKMEELMAVQNQSQELRITWHQNCLQMKESTLSNPIVGHLDVYCMKWLLVDHLLQLKACRN